MTEYRPLQEQAFIYLKDLILNGKLEPGIIYSETKIAAQIGVSRTPLKDALVRLSQDRYIDIIPSKGFRLHKIDKDDIYTTFQTRTAVEGFCALNLSRIRDTDYGKNILVQMRKNISMMENIVTDNGDIAILLQYDLQFHESMVRATKNEELVTLFESLNHRISFIALDSFAQPGRPMKALMEHKAIFSAISNAKSKAEIAPYLTIEQHMKASCDIALMHLS